MQQKKWFLRGLAVMLSTVIWMWIQLNEESTRTQSAILQFEFPDNLVEINPLPKTISLEMSGPKGRLRQLEEKELRLPIDLQSADVGTTSLTFNGNMIEGLPDSIKVERFTPPILDLEFATPIVREIPIKLNFIGTLNTEKSIARIEFNPTSLSVKGAEQLLNQTSEILTKPINLTELTQSTTLLTQAIRPANTLSFTDEPNIEVMLEIVERNIESVYSAIKLTNNNLNWTANVDTVDVLIKAPTDQDIQPDNLQVQVNLSAFMSALTPEEQTQSQSISFTDHPEIFSIQGISSNEIILLKIEPTTVIFSPK